MEADVREEFHALRRDNRLLREEVRADIKGLHEKLDGHIGAVNRRCAQRGEELAVLANHDRERERRIDRRIALGLLFVTALSLLLALVL